MLGNKRVDLFKEIEMLNLTIGSTEELEKSLKELAVKSKNGINPFNPYTNPYFSGLYRRG